MKTKPLTPQSRATTVSHSIIKLAKLIKHNSYVISCLERRKASTSAPFKGEDALQLYYLHRNNVQLKRKLSILIKRSEALFK